MYKSEFNKKYSSVDEHNYRKSLFHAKLAKVRAHNADPTKTWKEGINKFSDRTPEEFKQMLGLKKGMLYKQVRESKNVLQRKGKIDISPYANMTIDWREKGIISPVKDQGQCGSCWTFASAETIESYYALATGQIVELSEQQILDCTPNPNQCGGTGGCGGGTAELAYAQLITDGGIATEWTYPYTSYFGVNEACHRSSNTPAYVQISNYVNIPSNTYEGVIQHLATVGPLAISVDASTWSDYTSGVYNGCNQTNPDLDHAVQLVGFGTDPQYGDYWLVRNSWSPDYGELGYIRLKRQGPQFTCGIDLTPSDGDGCNGGPATETVCGTCGILYDALYPVVVAN